MQVIKITSEKKHKIETIALWMILILSTAVLFSLCLNEGIDYDEAYSYRTAHDNTMLGIIRVVLDAHDTDVPVWYMGLRLWSFLVGGWYYCLQDVCTVGNRIIHAVGSNGDT